MHVFPQHHPHIMTITCIRYRTDEQRYESENNIFLIFSYPRFSTTARSINFQYVCYERFLKNLTHNTPHGRNNNIYNTAAESNGNIANDIWTSINAWFIAYCPENFPRT